MRIFNLALDRIESFHTLPDIPYRDNPASAPTISTIWWE